MEATDNVSHLRLITAIPPLYPLEMNLLDSVLFSKCSQNDPETRKPCEPPAHFQQRVLRKSCGKLKAMFSFDLVLVQGRGWTRLVETPRLRSARLLLEPLSTHALLRVGPCLRVLELLEPHNGNPRLMHSMLIH